MKITVVSDVNDLQRYAAKWDDLAQHAAEKNVFFESWMLMPALEEWGKDSVRVILVWQGNEEDILIGMFPLVRKTGYRHLPFSYESIWRHIHCFLCTPLVRKGNEAECLASFFEWHQAESGTCSFLEFPFYSGDGPFREALGNYAAQSGRIVDEIEHYSRAVLTPSEKDADSYLQKALGGRRLKDMRRKSRQLAQEGEFSTVSLTDAEKLPTWIEDFLRLEKEGWKGGSGTAMALDEREKRFFSRVLEEGFRRQQLFIHQLILNDAPIAMQCTLKSGETGFAFKVVFDERYARNSPGMLLHVEYIRAFFEQSALCFIDSCAAPDSNLLNHLFRERRLIRSTVVSKNSRASRLILQLGKGLKRAKDLIKPPPKGEEENPVPADE